MSVEKKSLWGIAASLANTSNEPQWSVVIAPSGLVKEHANLLEEELVCLLEPMKVCRRTAGTPEEIQTLAATNTKDFLVFDIGNFQEIDWTHLDNARSLLIKAHAVIVLEETQAENIANYAPNLWSWIGTSVWVCVEDSVLSEDQRQQRLQALREYYDLTDEQVVEHAKTKTLPPDPNFEEWLILLDQRELLEQGPFA